MLEDVVFEIKLMPKPNNQNALDNRLFYKPGVGYGLRDSKQQRLSPGLEE